MESNSPKRRLSSALLPAVGCGRRLARGPGARRPHAHRNWRPAHEQQMPCPRAPPPSGPGATAPAHFVEVLRIVPYSIAEWADARGPGRRRLTRARHKRVAVAARGHPRLCCCRRCDPRRGRRRSCRSYAVAAAAVQQGRQAHTASRHCGQSCVAAAPPAAAVVARPPGCEGGTGCVAVRVQQ
jgi:hypothetical protein